MLGNALYKKLFAMVLGLSLVAASSTAFAGGVETRLRAELAGIGDISGQADFRDKEGRKKFSVEVEGLTPNSMFDVMVAGVVVGTVTTDGLGFGDFNLDSNFEPGDVTPDLPGNFPALNGGEKVEVGPLTGNLQPK